MDKQVIAWIDHELGEGRKEDLRGMVLDRMGEAKCNVDNRPVQLRDIFEFDVTVVPVTSTPPVAGVGATIDWILNSYAGKHVDLFMVDLIFLLDHGNEKIGSDNAIKIASGLSERTSSAVGLFTRGGAIPEAIRLNVSTYPEISLFAVQFDKIHPDGVPSMRIDASGWKGYFDRAISARQPRCVLPKLSAEPPEITWGKCTTMRSRPASARAVDVLSKLIMRRVAPDAASIELEELGGGFSGSYVIRARADDLEKRWIIKVDEDPNRLQKEIQGYKAFEQRVQGKHFCHLHSVTSNAPILIASDWWGAIALEEDVDGVPLLQKACRLDGDGLSAVYNGVWTSALEWLYGKPSSSRETAMGTLAGLDADRLRHALHKLHRYLVHAQIGLDPALKPAIARAEKWLRNGLALPVPLGGDLNVPYAENIHGDLNCRNILCGRNKADFRLIDFPNVGKGCLAKDYAKAETELVLLIMEWAEGRDCDFARIDAWSRLTAKLDHFADGPICRDGVDGELHKFVDAVSTIRRLYAGACSTIDNVDFERAYLLFLIRQIAPYITYDDITPAKKVLALCWIGQILSR